MIKMDTINEIVNVRLKPSEFEAIQYALKSLVRHESISSDEHYGFVHTASEFLERAVAEDKKEEANNPFWGSDYKT